jgi:hypothetical protein
MDLQTKFNQLLVILKWSILALIVGLLLGFVLFYGTYWLVYDVMETTLLDILIY